MMRKKTSLTQRIIWAVVGCSLFLLVLKSSEWQTRMASYIAQPFINVQHWVQGIRRRRTAEKESYQQLVARCSALIAERDLLSRQLIECESAHRYEDDSKDVRQFRKRFHLDHARIAQVIMVNRSPAGHFIFVSSGSAHGVEPDMVVLANNCLIGRVSEVYAHYSKVLLTTDKNCRVAAICTKTGARGIHEGCNDEATTRLAFVSHFDRVEVGDMVVSHGAGLVFPRGFALGKVASVVTTGVFHAVTVTPFIDINTVDFCLVVRRQDVEVTVCAPVADESTPSQILSPLPKTSVLPVRGEKGESTVPAKPVRMLEQGDQPQAKQETAAVALQEPALAVASEMLPMPEPIEPEIEAVEQDLVVVPDEAERPTIAESEEAVQTGEGRDD